jgi:serine kinase of HPr protein (carbohydrate metabolism regulator)
MPEELSPAELVHATCIAIAGRGVLIAGKSGAGKSDLALRLIDRGATLVSDDYTLVEPKDDALVAHAPERIAGSIEVRGIGLLAVPHLASAPIALLIDLDEAADRMPVVQHHTIAGLPLPRLALAPFEASAPIKLELALRTFGLP